MKKHLSKLSFLVIGLSLAATVSYLNAWTGPTQTAPAGNVGAPVNLSALSQIKLGGLSVASLLSTGAIGASQYCDALGQNCSTPPFGGSSVPVGTVAAFNLTTCPAGWIPADGTNNTRDLRGVFIRGMESFNGGTTASSSDPDRTGSATLGSYQADMYASHTHGYNMAYNAGPIADAYGGPTLGVFYLNQGASTGGAGGNETRPKNVALLFCQKDSSVSGGGSVNDPLASFKTAMGISLFPNHVVCKIGGDVNFRDVYNLQNVDIANDRVTYNEQGTVYVTYSRATGARTSGTTYCPSQLDRDGSLTQL